MLSVFGSRVGLLAYSPLAMGLLSGKYLAADGGSPNSRLNLYRGSFDLLLTMNIQNIYEYLYRGWQVFMLGKALTLRKYPHNSSIRQSQVA